MKATRILQVCLITLFSSGIFTSCKKKENPAPTTTTTGTGTTVNVQPDANTGMDAVIASGAPTTNYGPSYTELTALSGTASGNNIAIRGLIKFDLSSIPSGKTATSAKLSLYGSTDPGNGANSMFGTANACYIQRITSAWTESTVTWNNQPTITATNRVSLAASSVDTDYTDVDVTALVNDMISNSSTSFGFELVLQNESGYNSMQFASSDCSDATKRPKLVIVY